MAIFRSTDLATSRIEVVTARLDVAPDELQAAQALLNPAERAKAGRQVFERGRRRCVVARARLRELLGERLGTPPERIELTYGAHGKPALARPFAGSDLRFNVSHCEDVAAYAFSYGREIGVDVETVRDMPDADEIAQRFFSRREVEAYLALPARDRPLGFFNCWTRKEAFIKALGTGLSHPLGAFDVSLAPGEPARLLHVAGRQDPPRDWTLHEFAPGPGLVGAVAVETA